MRIVQTFFNACHAGRSGGAERWTGGRFKTSNEGGLTKCQSGLESGEASALADGGKDPLEYGFFNTCYAGRSGRAERGWPHAEYRSACRFAFSAKNYE